VRRKVIPLFSEDQADIVRLQRLLGLLEDAAVRPVTFTDEALERAGFRTGAARTAVVSEDPWLTSDHPEARCERCGRPNVWSWAAPSPLWNAVMRDPATGQDEFSIVCPPCFAELTALKGLGGSSFHRLPRWTWRFAPEGVDVANLWVDADGRVWDDKRWLWVEREALR
jgi:hypothetical protein